MKPIQTFNVSPALPAELSQLSDLAYDLRWSWDYTARSLFRRLDPELWESSARNPILMLGEIDQQRLDQVVKDAGFMAHYHRVCHNRDAYLNSEHTWCIEVHGKKKSMCIAYFSAEFAITDCMPIYSGGLGVLAGDHLKSASNLGLPLVAVGLLYQKGYFRQHLSTDGWQEETLTDNDFFTMPVRPVTLPDGELLKVNVPMNDRSLGVGVWYVQVGRVTLYLLDSNLAENSPADREITAQLYGGDHDMRIRQEIILGIGGMRALNALQIFPQVCHMNEGHTAFLALERIRQLTQHKGLSFDEAREVARAGHVFTTHTPVPAGNDYFPPEMVRHYFGSYCRELNLNIEEFLGLGRIHPEDPNEAFCMTVLALRLSDHNNAVSRLHQSVSRDMWADLWPETPSAEIPISHVTNGIHAKSWISHDLSDLLDSYLSPGWQENPGDQSTWSLISSVPEEELWRIHERRRERLVAYTRRRLRQQLKHQGASGLEMLSADSVLDPQVFTIGFARRFATYKRPLLLLREPERLMRLLNNEDRPVQLIFAGKAHPHDEEGKKMIRNLVRLSREPAFRKKIAFIEDYDLDVARYMTQGVDVWLNTPIRPMEASGTSGMKAAVNGVLNLSILDGWWDEAYNPDIGWAIGRGEAAIYPNDTVRDDVEAAALYHLLEQEIVPLFYERGKHNIPRYWVQRMKKAMTQLCPIFNTNRMLCEYATRFYFPASEHFSRMIATDFAPGKDLAAWKAKVNKLWQQINIVSVNAQIQEAQRVGDSLPVEVQVSLGELTENDVQVQLCLGRIDHQDELIEPSIIPMELSHRENDRWTFRATAAPCCRSGLHGFTVRVLPYHPDLGSPWEMGKVKWAQ